MLPVRRLGWLAATALCGSFAGVGYAAPASSDARDKRIEALEAQVQALTNVVNDLKAKQAAPAPTAATAPAGTPTFANNPGAGGKGPFSPDQATPAPSGPGPNQGGVTIVAGKPSIQSGDGRFSANLHAVVQFDVAGYFQRGAGSPTTDFRRGAATGDTAHARDLNNGSNFRRVRLGVDGKAFGDFDYNVLLEFGGAGEEDAGHIQEAWLQYSGIKNFKFRIGAFPPLVGLEDQNSTNGMPFLERPAIADIARSIAGGDYREAAQFIGSGSRWLAALALTTRTVGTINANGTTVTAQPYDEAFGAIVRLAAIPFQGDDWMVHVGAHGTRVLSVADAGGPDVGSGVRYGVTFQERPELRVDGTRLISSNSNAAGTAIDARHVTEGGLELALQKQQFYIQGEYERIGVERRASTLSDPHFSGWYVEGSWILTGERRKYNTNTFSFDGPAVDHPFDLRNGTWGALELAARYSTVNLNYHQGAAGKAIPADGIRGGEQQIAAAGLNWYLNPMIRFMLQYQHVKIDRLSPSTAFVPVVGAQIGQTYNTIALRSQIAF